MRQSRQVLIRWSTILEVLEDIVNQSEARNITLLVCSSKDEFLLQLTALIRSPQRSGDEQCHGSVEQDNIQSTRKLHPLLTRTLHLLSASQNVRLIFCSTITILRAHISVGLESRHQDASTRIPSKLIILNLLALHHGTSEFSLQGLSRTAASLVSTARRSNHQVQLVECKDGQDPTDPNRGPALWDAQIPLLSGSVKIAGAGANWAKRSISVRKVIERWFEFEGEL